MLKSIKIFGILSLTLITSFAYGQGTRLLRQPSLSSTHVAFAYGGDIWISNLSDGSSLRLTSTPAIESNPHISPDGQTVAFSSNRSGNTAVYIVPITGGEPTRLTWHPSAAVPRGWTPDGKRVLYATGRDSAPTGINRLWTVSTEGGPSEKVAEQWGFDGSYSSDGTHMVIDRVSRWDVEWRAYF